MISLDAIRVVIEPDDSPDTSWLGEFSDDPAPWAIVREEGEYLENLGDDFELPRRGREYRFFVPYAGGEKPGTAEHQQNGKQDHARMEAMSRGDWWFVGIYAEATVSYATGNARRAGRFRSGGLWGIESDAGDDYLQEVAEEQLHELREHLAVFGVDLSDFDQLAAEAIEASSV